MGHGSRPARLIKTIVEWHLALAALVVLSPLIAIAAAAVRGSGPGPVIYRRRVLGQGGVPFDAFKFRTMVQDAEARLERDPELKRRYVDQYKLRDDPRVTGVGRLLRRYSLDELPQLLNVLRGEMALVGPRIVSPEEIVKYGEHRDRLFSVRPGLTGLWQVSGRQTTTYEERVALDLKYITGWSPWLDLSIVLRTPRAVLRSDGAY
jgi:lipopolysaccharide/colanic/teichoic acid biosynthesis glycosyltransferase